MIKKTMHFQKRHILTLLFSAYFLLYVLSPLCFAQDGLHDDSPVVYKTYPNTKNIRVIWELILTNIYKKGQDNNGNRQAHVQLLLKKAKALVNSGSTVKLSKSVSAEIFPGDIWSYPGYAASFVPFEKPLFQGFTCLLSSGLSPPAV